ncbi:hypothetical protein G9C85_05085 [Halorubellus sp. JP-L1]|uniref:helix-turn-helix transcriptional regulator n=1 Tax=Halorubellus sp. JP-L1 TaxID=2715753 RepID=UPI00140D8BBA|nr:hypothetical protein [Halorubellus sp. JP-L1]NHN41011.1 hypothetical protein [Halorubellus sp. JP-L1]
MRRVSRLVVVVLVLSLPVAGLVAVEDAPDSASATIGSQADVNAQEFDSTTFIVTPYANGTATFTIRYERRLANQSEREQFETFAERFENESTDLSENFQSRATSLTAAGRNATGRDMTASSFTRDARVEEQFNTLGIVELSFQWSAFGVVRDDGSVVVGDVFDGGIYLGPNQALVFQHGPGLQFQRVDPAGSASGETLPSSDSVTWQGEQDFSDERPRATFVPAGSGTTTPGDGSTTAPGGDGTDAGSRTDDAAGGDGLGMLPMVVLALVAVLVAAFAVREYGGDLVTTDGSRGDDADATADATTESAAGSGASDPDASNAAPAVADEELLTDEDRVVSLLEEHGGRMRQVNIVDQTGWSKSKVSMLLSDMEDDDVISKLRVGRENIVSLDGHEPDVAGSPFDDDGDT